MVTQDVAFKDYYAALELSIGAVSADVEAAYRALVRESSRNTEDASRLAELTEAYQVLASPAFRREYDQLWVLYRGRPEHAAAGNEIAGSGPAAPPPLAVMAKQHMRARPRRASPAGRRRLGRRFLVAFTLGMAFWIMVGAVLASPWPGF